MQPDEKAAQIVRDVFDGTEASVVKAVRLIGKALRSAAPRAADPRQIEMYQEVNRGN
jgi:hypothetical protein